MGRGGILMEHVPLLSLSLGATMGVSHLCPILFFPLRSPALFPPPLADFEISSKKIPHEKFFEGKFSPLEQSGAFWGVRLAFVGFWGRFFFTKVGLFSFY